MKTHEEKRMAQALTLARRGISAAEPNPAVGCIIEKDGQVIGKGWHKVFGGAHAEINALNECSRSGVDTQDATAYVTLEPCCHQGKTGPCTEAIINAGISKVIVACVDPSVHNSGQGIQQLRQAGIEVITGVCETECQLLNAPFFKFTRTGEPWVVLKWAQSLDGKLAYADTKESNPRWISNQASRSDVHKLRRRTQAILVGINTVMADDPLLTPRPDKGKNPLRIVLDNTLKIPLNSQLVNTAQVHPLLIVTRETALSLQADKVRSLQHKGAELLTLDPSESNLHGLYRELSCRGIQQLLVEGGPQVLSSFLRENLTDELWVYVSPALLGSSGTADLPFTLNSLSSVSLYHTQIRVFDGNVRIQGLLNPITDLAE